MNPTNPAYPNKTYPSNNSLFPLLSSPLPLPVSNATSRSQLKSYQKTNPNPRSAQAQVLRLSFAGMAQLILVLLLVFNLALDASNFRNAVTQAAAQAQAQATAAAQTSAVPNEAGSGAGAGNIPPIGGVLAGAASFAAHLTAPFLLTPGSVCPTQTSTLTPTLTYLGATSSSWGNALGLAALLTDPAGNPLASNVLTFTLSPGNGSGSPVLTTTATTDTNGFARTVITPTTLALPPGAATLKAAWPGSTSGSGGGGSGPSYNPVTLSQAVTLTLEPTIISYTGNGLPGLTAPAQPVSAKLLDAFTGLPIVGVTLSFSLGSAPVVSATTDATGTASATLALTPDQAIGQPPLVVRWAGDTFRQASSLNVPSSFYLDSAFGTVVVRHAPNFSSNARVTGSIRQLLPEYDTLNTGVVINGDLLVPGSPSVQTNGSGITFGGVVTGTGSASPSNYSVSLNDNTTLGHLIIRTDAVTLSAVPAPPSPTGTRDISINGPSDTIGNPATLRNVTLNTNAGAVALPPGTYGTFSANTGSSYVLGITGTITPVVYNVQGLSFNGTASLSVVGPIILNTATGFSFGGLLGNSAQPLWLEVNVTDQSGITLNTGATFYGVARSPSGGITLNGGTTLKGSVFADRLSFNSGSVATIQGVSVPTSTTTTAPVLVGSLYPAGSSPTAPTGPVILPGGTFNWQLAVTNTTAAGGGGGSATSVVAGSNFPNTLPNTRTTTISSLLAAGGASTTASLTETVASFTTTRQTTTESSPSYQTRLGTQNGVSLWGRSLLSWGDTSDQAYAPLNVLGQPTPTEGLPLLSLGLSTPAGCAIAGSVLTYTVRVSNVGSAAAQSGTMGLTYPDATTGTLSFGPLAVGGVYTSSLSWSVPASTTQSSLLTTKGQVNWQDGATNPGPNSYGPVEAQLLTSIGTNGGGGGGGGTGGTPGLFFQTGPGGAQAGLPFLTQPVVVKLLGDGTTDTAFNGPITLTLKSGTGTSGAVLSGPTIVNAVGGIATYGGLSINLVGTGYVLTTSAASSTGLSPVDSPAFNVVTARTGPTTIVARSGGGQTATTGQGFGSPLIAFVSNGNGQSVGAGTSVTFVIMTGSSGAGATFTGTGGGTSVTVATDANGLATTPALTANGTAGTFLVKATTPGVGAGANFVLNNSVPSTGANGVTITLVPVVSGPNPINSTVTLTATLTRYGATPLPGQNVSFLVTDLSGTTITTTSATTLSDGTASFSYSSPLTGTHLVTATVNVGGVSFASRPSTIYWISTSRPVATTTAIGRFYKGNGENNPYWSNPSVPPVFTQSFSGPIFNPIGGLVPNTPAGLVYGDNPHPIVNISTDANGNFAGSTPLEGNGNAVLSAIGGKTDLLYGFRMALTANFIVSQSGVMTFSLFNDNQVRMGVGADQFGHSPSVVCQSNCPPSSSSFISNLPIVYDSGGYFGNATVSVNFPAPGVYPYELDWAGDQDRDGLSLVDVSGRALPPGTSLTLTPVSNSDLDPLQNTVGLTQTFTIKAIGADGSPLPRLDIVVNVSGTNTSIIGSGSSTGTTLVQTGVDGTATFSYVGQTSGIDTVQAQAWLTGLPFSSNQASVQWYCGPAPSSVFSDNFADLSKWNFQPYSGGASANWSAANNRLTASSVTGEVLAVSKDTINGINYTYEADFIPLTNSSYGGFNLYSANGNNTLIRFLAGFNSSSHTNLVYLDTPGPGTYYIAQYSVGLSFTVGSRYHFRLNSVSNNQFAFSINGITQYVVSLPSLGGPGNKVNLLGGGGDFGFENVSVKNGYPVTPPATAICSGGGGGNGNPSVGCTINSNWLTSPVNHTSVSNTIAITLSPNISLPVGAKLQYYPTNNPTAQSLVTFYTVTNQPISVGGYVTNLDTTLLANGSYILRVVYSDANGNCQSNLTLFTVVGENKPGRVTFSLTDLMVPVAGLPVAIGRTYDSLDRGQQEDFGYGWKLSIGNPKLEVNPAGDVTLTTPDGRRITFNFTPGSASDEEVEFLGQQPINVFGFLLKPLYTPEAGAHGRLRTDGCGIVTPGATFGGYVCFPGSSYQDTINVYVYTDPYGREYTMSAKGSNIGKLISVKDMNGNINYFNEDGISTNTSAKGNCKAGDSSYLVCYGRDNKGRITTITDTMGYVYQYSYNTVGDLTGVTLPGTSTPLTYTYYTGNIGNVSFDHFFKEGFDPRGNRTAFSNYDNNGRLTSVSDAVGNTTQYTYTLSTNTTLITHQDSGRIFLQTDDYGNVISQTLDIQNTGNFTQRNTQYSYDAKHNLTQLSLPNPSTGQSDPSRLITYAYDVRGNHTVMTNTLGFVTKSRYNPFGGPIQLSDPLQHTWYTSNDPSFSPTTVTDTLGTLGGYTFDDFGDIASQADGNGSKVYFTYDQYGNKASETNTLGHATYYQYDNMGHMTALTDAVGSVTRYDYDPLGRIKNITDTVGNVTHYTYDQNGNQIQVDQPGGRTTRYDYDAANRLITTTWAVGTSSIISTSSTYDWRGNKLTDTDQAGRVARYGYDLAGQLITTTIASGTPDQAVMVDAYDLAGRKTGETNANSQTTLYVYDTLDRIVNKKTPLYQSSGSVISATTVYTYDQADHVIKISDPDSHETSFEYDMRGRLLKTIYPTLADGTVLSTTQSYDAAGNLQLKTDQAGKSTVYSYDSVNRLLAVSDALSQTTKYSYDPMGRLLSIRDANSHQTGFAYDPLGRQSQKIWPDGSFESYGYDQVSNRTNITVTRLSNEAAQTNLFTYNKLDQLVQANYFDGRVVTTTYTPTGLRNTVVDTAQNANQATLYNYDQRDRVIQITQPDGGSNPRAVRYQYDALGNRTVMTLTVAGNAVSVTGYGYDLANRLISVTNPSQFSGTATYNYDSLGLRTQLILPNGVRTNYNYDTLNRLINITQTNAASAILASYAYRLDAEGNRLKVTEVGGNSIEWGYDALYRLSAEARKDSGGSVLTNTTYSYDPVGNRLKQTLTTGGVTKINNYNYNELDQMASELDSGYGSSSYGYNRRGSLTQITTTNGVTSYNYDAANRLVGVILPNSGGSSTYVYDADDKKVSQTTGSSTTNYLWDETSPYGDVVLETDQSNSVQNSYVLGGSDLISQKNSSNLNSYFLSDGEGNTRALTDNGGNIQQSYNYDAFGNLQITSTTPSTSYLYGGQQLDKLSDLYNMRARYYNPGSGNFLSRDMASYSQENPITLDRYSYAHNDPINYKDPSGFVETLAPPTTAEAPVEESVQNTGRSRGGRLIEYTLLVGLMAAVTFGTIAATGRSTSCSYSYIESIFFASIKNGPALVALEAVTSPDCMIPVVKFPEPTFPYIARHTWTAQYIRARPMLLTYNAVPSAGNPNRSGVCTDVQIRELRLLDPSVPRPDQCDEYPYASTFEGGIQTTSGFAQLPSLAMVPAGENRAQGGKLTQFYRGRGDNRTGIPMIKGDRFAAVALFPGIT